MTHALPRYDAAAVFDVATNLFIYPAMLIAHRLGLFERLGEGPRTLDEIGAALGLARRPAEVLVNASVSLGMRFMRAMESLSASHALAWPTKLDLARHRVMLDVGGGSGANAVGALSAWPSLRAGASAWRCIRATCGAIRFLRPICISTRTSFTAGRPTGTRCSCARASMRCRVAGASCCTRCCISRRQGRAARRRRMAIETIPGISAS